MSNKSIDKVKTIVLSINDLERAIFSLFYKTDHESIEAVKEYQAVINTIKNEQKEKENDDDDSHPEIIVDEDEWI